MEFHSPTLSDHGWVQEAFDFGQTDCCEYCFGNIFMWSDIYDNKIYNDNGIFVSADFTDEPVFCYPIGNGDKKATSRSKQIHGSLLETVHHRHTGSLGFPSQGSQRSHTANRRFGAVRLGAQLALSLRKPGRCLPQ